MTLLTETSLEPFIALLKAQGRRAVLEVCCGPGDDGIRFVRAGTITQAWILSTGTSALPFPAG